MKLIKIASEYLTLYHGTSDVNAEKIRVEGLRHNNLGAGWYTLADNYEDAKFHSSVGNGKSVVVEFRIPDVTDERTGLNKWVWKPQKAMSGNWYALREALPKEFVVDIREVEGNDEVN
jgi:hypothetical protein